jgi:hypothetical protein
MRVVLVSNWCHGLDCASAGISAPDSADSTGACAQAGLSPERAPGAASRAMLGPLMALTGGDSGPDVACTVR